MLINFCHLLCKLDDVYDHPESLDKDENEDNEDGETEALTPRNVKKGNCHYL